MDALPQHHVNQSWSSLPWDVGRVGGESWVLQPVSVSSTLVVLTVLLPTGFGHQEVHLWRVWRMGPSGSIIPHGYLPLRSSISFLLFFTVTSQSLLKLCPRFSHIIKASLPFFK